MNLKGQSLIFRQSPYFCVLGINLLHLHMVVLCTLLRKRCNISCRLKVIDHSKIIKQCTVGEFCGKIIRTSVVCSELAFYSFLLISDASTLTSLFEGFELQWLNRHFSFLWHKRQHPVFSKYFQVTPFPLFSFVEFLTLTVNISLALITRCSPS